MLTPESQLALAIKVASEGHHGQFDKAKKPYILHPLRVMMAVAYTGDPEIMAMAIMHDYVEDVLLKRHTFDEAFKFLEMLGFSQRVIAALKLLTHIEHETYEEYIRKIATSLDASIVKMADLKDNSDLTRLKGVSPKDIARMEKYIKAYAYLEGVIKVFKGIYQ